MAIFGTASKRRLETAHPDLRRWAERLILRFDFTVVCCYRGEEEQEAAFVNGKSQLHYPNSKHNKFPSQAIDLAPWDAVEGRIAWNRTDRFIYLAGMGMELAAAMDIQMRWGGCWSRDTRMDDSFKDYPHYELVEGRV